ncbi:MAG TPA: type VI secretion system baseplate subunit TssK [Candidatus Angelobacter sp.]|nr:type VI secretion system baseplate subunit TssK [Candidatus Angelobacter sp.]
MKSLCRVVWWEGMYLGPHHFQTQSRYFEDSIRFAVEHSWFEPWGILSFKLDESAIENGRVAVLDAHGIFEDGLIFEMPGADALPSERNIRDQFSPLAESLTILLAVPKRRHAQQNTDLQGASTSTRYRAVEHNIRDVNNGIDEKGVSLCQKNIRIITEQEMSDDLLTIPLAQVKRDGAGHLVYDPQFVPPCTKLTASDWLLALLRRLTDLFEEKRKVLIQPRGKPGKFQAGASQMEISNFWFLHTINDGLSLLRHLCFSKRGHPEELFRELSRIAGALCTFNIESDPSTLPVYDHRRLSECFSALDEHIRRHLEILVPSNAIEIPIQQSHANLYTGDVTDPRCFGRTRWILGIKSAAGEAQVLNKAPYLIKMCSRVFVGELVRRAMPGLSLTHLQVLPSALPAKVDLQYFSISQSGPCWNHISETRQIGIYVPDELPNATIELQVILES